MTVHFTSPLAPPATHRREAAVVVAPLAPKARGRLRELPPFGEPDAAYPPAAGAVERTDDPHGVFMPTPETAARGTR